jgi:hypothetical protein
MAAEATGHPEKTTATSLPIGASHAVCGMETAMQVSTFEVLKQLLPTAALSQPL